MSCNATSHQGASLCTVSPYSSHLSTVWTNCSLDLLSLEVRADRTAPAQHCVCAAGQTERVLPQWLTGITAVAIFLFLAFVTFLVNKAWCGSPSRSVTRTDTCTVPTFKEDLCGDKNRGGRRRQLAERQEEEQAALRRCEEEDQKLFLQVFC
uniref:Small integral membrane protein 24 n=1 Tax=Mola mola TaxID=94237 RepID=A0A3Q3W083_MOLML